jgi:hypothetical protein
MEMVMDWPPIEPRQTKTYSISINTARTASDSSGWKPDSTPLNYKPVVYSKVEERYPDFRRGNMRPKDEQTNSIAALAA